MRSWANFAASATRRTSVSRVQPPIAISIRSATDGRTCLRSAKQLSARRSFPEELWCCRHSILGAGKGHELYEDNGTHPRLTRVDLFDNGELLWRIGRPQGHDEAATHFELLDQRWRDMPKCGCDDDCVERTAFRPSLITVADLDTHIVITELSSTFAAASASGGIISTVQTLRTRRARVRPGNLNPCQLPGPYRRT